MEGELLRNAAETELSTATARVARDTDLYETNSDTSANRTLIWKSTTLLCKQYFYIASVLNKVILKRIPDMVLKKQDNHF
ncbi:MAG: hypothetical protein MRQ13_05335, partial [Candidatus Midichloria sp.]|nr:hypothetical protein [Candidatus Midichloria sp.]